VGLRATGAVAGQAWAGVVVRIEVTSAVVSGVPPMAQEPLAISSTVTHVTPRMASPSTLTIASVTARTIWAFSSDPKTPSITFT
jgi:hypothetical protein